MVVSSTQQIVGCSLLLIPWDRVEEKYVKSLQALHIGQMAYTARIALGSLIIKERLGLSDRETTLQIQENPYLQFFIGYTAYVDKEPFHHSLLTHFRQRFGAEIITEVNDWIAQAALQAEGEAKAKQEASKKHRDDDDNGTGGFQLTMEMGEALSVPEEPTNVSKKGRPAVRKLHLLSSEDTAATPPAHVTNKGTLMLDATCAPADIKYPTDLGLLNHAREILEGIIDVLHAPLSVKERSRANLRAKSFVEQSKSS
ncbi:UNVERIFIED_CONTAM: hypothetical protein ABIC26_005213 [Paenibacillus sp. PvR008]